MNESVQFEMNDFERAKFEARKAAEKMTLAEAVKQMDELRALKESQEADLKETNAWYDVLRFETVPTKMADEGIDKISYEGIGRVSITADLLVATKPGVKDQLFNWFRNNGLGDLIQPNVNSSTLKAWVKDRIKTGKSYPDDLLNVTPIERASITKR